MKVLFISILLMNVAFTQRVDFEDIFQQIKEAHTVTEAMAVREKYLPRMNSLADFNRLTNLEALRRGEHFFSTYQRALGKFVLENVTDFMLDADSFEDKELYARRVVPKGYGSSITYSLLELGLFYVYDCEGFQEYVGMAKAPSSFISQNQLRFCYGSSEANHFKTFELISNLELRDGEYKSILLPAMLFVEKIYISVEGSRGSTFFDVMVNGEAKGTIYAPGRDPLYIVTIMDSTSEINLRSLGGNARIHSIKVQVR